METLDERIEHALVPEEVDVDEEIVWRDENPEKPARFVVDNASKADWALRKLQAVRAQKAENLAQADRIMEQTRGWLEEVNGSAAKRESFFESLLNEFHLAQLREDPKRKTIKCPAGTLTARQAPPSLAVDVDVFLKWFESDPDHAEQFPDVVRVVKTPDKNAIKQTFDAREDGSLWDKTTGEIVDGATVLEGGINFTVKTTQEVTD